MIHQYKLNGYNIILDINSGSVHSVDEVAYDIIGMYENTDKEEIITKILDLICTWNQRHCYWKENIKLMFY